MSEKSTTPKSSELIQAQVATFAAEGVKDPHDNWHILNNLGDIALGQSGGVTSVTDSAGYYEAENGDLSGIFSRYTAFLRTVGGSQYEAIQGRAGMLNDYNGFGPEIAILKSELLNLATGKEHHNFLGTGSNSMVFSITKGDKAYAVRVPHGRDSNPAAINSHLAGAVLGKGVPHLEQIVAASYKDGVTVAEMMPGKEVGNLTIDEAQAVTNEQLGVLVDTLIAVSERGIEIDSKPSNIFYDPKEGYGIVDYHSSKVAGKISADQDLGTIVGRMAVVIDNSGFYGKPYISEKSAEDYANNLKFKRANLGTLERYRNVVEAKLDGESLTKALNVIDKRIATGKEAVLYYSNPDWVSEQIAQGRERERQRKEPKNNPTGYLVTPDIL
ncbi:hypothetical protein KC952_00265 [Candidatus Saccharibacteria bacterium]|nr:hypothetical protein [Candidatus Saccharibacteria bacterium]